MLPRVHDALLTDYAARALQVDTLSRLAHLVDLTFRRLSFHRDGLTPPPLPRPIHSERGFVDFINGLNGEWVAAAKRITPRVLTDLFEKASADLADFFEALPMDAPALFGVSWAGEQTSAGWFDVGREFTELWHHQEQIRRSSCWIRLRGDCCSTRCLRQRRRKR